MFSMETFPMSVYLLRLCKNVVPRPRRVYLFWLVVKPGATWRQKLSPSLFSAETDFIWGIW